MNFFEHQDAARRSTRLLVFLYALTVVCIAAAVYFAFLGILYLNQPEPAYGLRPAISLWHPELFFNVFGIVLALVIFGTAYKILQLRQGGKTVAELLGGRLIPPDTRDPEERKLLNVVEEMAIASGTSVPPVYLLKNEKGINAFAAGFSTRDGVIGVTEGSMKLLSRDELQGVIAHEFSHILNGDMRLNLRLMGILHGILLIALAGRLMLHMMGRGAVLGSRRGRGGGNAALAIMFAGFVLLVIGYVGVFFASLIKSAVSRQRESLADASAVQFTRYPEGLASALKKIGGLESGSSVKHPKAEEASHFYFANGLCGNLLYELFSTHPPLTERIKKLEPGFDGKFPRVEYPKPEPSPKKQEKDASFFARHVAAAAAALDPLTIVAGAGQVSETNLAYAASLIHQIPEFLRQQVKEPVGARAIIYSLLLDRHNPEVKKSQQHHLFLYGNYQVHRQMMRIAEEVAALDVRLRLPLVDLSLPALTTLSERQYEQFRKTTEEIMLSDGVMHPFELAMKLVLFHHLDGFYGYRSGGAKPAAQGDVPESGRELLSMLACLGNQDREKAAAAFREAHAVWEPSSKTPPEMTFSETPDAARVEAALASIRNASFKNKEKFLVACACAIRHDGKILPEELEMIRAFADTLDCPLPPLA